MSCPVAIAGVEAGGRNWMSAARRLLRPLFREPLVGFLCVGIAMFAVHALIGDDEETDTQEIRVDRGTLSRFMQLRSRSFNESGVARRYDAMTPAERQQLLREYVREEALYREARGWGLDREDYVVRRRIVQSLEYALADDASVTTIDDDQLQAFYASHRDRYVTPPSLSFTHVFFSLERHGRTQARALAERALVDFNHVQARTATIGDRFLYFKNYVDQSAALIASHFGTEAARMMMAMKPDARRWQGPVESDHGFHVLLVHRSDPGGAIPFEQAREHVAHDARETARVTRLEAAVAQIVDSYRVTLADNLKVGL